MNSNFRASLAFTFSPSRGTTRCSSQRSRVLFGWGSRSSVGAVHAVGSQRPDVPAASSWPWSLVFMIRSGAFLSSLNQWPGYEQFLLGSLQTGFRETIGSLRGVLWRRRHHRLTSSWPEKAGMIVALPGVPTATLLDPVEPHGFSSTPMLRRLAGRPSFLQSTSS
jgi:hypothetical protein